MIAVLDYGVGNTKAILNIYERMNIDVKAANSSNQLDEVDKIILPGVGAFDWAMEKFEQAKISDAVNKHVLIKKKPILGICVGMQMMTNGSHEGTLPGFGWFDTSCEKFNNKTSSRVLRLPHMGWNNVRVEKKNLLFKNIDMPLFYFLHSYHLKPKSDGAIATANYGYDFVCALADKNIFGVQFHPEKSHHWGTQLLKNFAAL